MADVGDQLQASTGHWSSPPTSFTYQWQSSADPNTGFVDISGETRSDYIVQAGDLGLYLRVGVVATNSAGPSDVEYSSSVGPVGDGPPPVQIPVLSTSPVATGDVHVGDTVSCTTGVWTNTPTSYGYQWQSSANGTTGWADLSGKTSSTYQIQQPQLGKYLRCTVVASNTAGSSSAAPSNALGPVVARPRPPHGGSSPGGSMLPGGTNVYLARKSARKTGFKRRKR